MSETEQTEIAAAPAAKDATKYVVLTWNGDAWEVEKTVEARSSEAAIRQWAEARTTGSPDDAPTTAVAVPERSWKPVKVTPKTTTTLTFEDA